MKHFHFFATYIKKAGYLLLYVRLFLVLRNQHNEQTESIPTLCSEGIYLCVVPACAFSNFSGSKSAKTSIGKRLQKKSPQPMETRRKPVCLLVPQNNEIILEKARKQMFFCKNHKDDPSFSPIAFKRIISSR